MTKTVMNNAHSYKNGVYLNGMFYHNHQYKRTMASDGIVSIFDNTVCVARFNSQTTHYYDMLYSKDKEPENFNYESFWVHKCKEDAILTILPEQPEQDESDKETEE